MFDVGFSELLMIGIIALIVLGPERLPKAARFAGLWVRRARAQWYSVKSELERELAADELKRSVRDTRAAVQDIDAEIRASAAETQREFAAMRGQVVMTGTQQADQSLDQPLDKPLDKPVNQPLDHSLDRLNHADSMVTVADDAKPSHEPTDVGR